jgi:hypothetical protein
MVIALIILGIIIFFGIVRIIAQPRQGFWHNLQCVFYIDVISDFIDDLKEDIEDRN